MHVRVSVCDRECECVCRWLGSSLGIKYLILCSHPLVGLLLGGDGVCAIELFEIRDFLHRRSGGTFESECTLTLSLSLTHSLPSSMYFKPKFSHFPLLAIPLPSLSLFRCSLRADEQLRHVDGGHEWSG